MYWFWKTAHTFEKNILRYYPATHFISGKKMFFKCPVLLVGPVFSCPWGDVSLALFPDGIHIVNMKWLKWGHMSSGDDKGLHQNPIRGSIAFAQEWYQWRLSDHMSNNRSGLSLCTRIHQRTRHLLVNVRLPSPLYCWSHIRHLTYLHPEEKWKWGDQKIGKEFTWVMKVELNYLKKQQTTRLD